MLMIDPKMLELSVYEGIPHLLAPVVTDMKEAANGLRWCVAEMERRYKLMSAVGVRNLAGFNRKVKDARGRRAAADGSAVQAERGTRRSCRGRWKTLPYIVVFIDEFADMMMIVGKKVEELIARLAQKARAAGIHLILATQRPSVDVITGLIKANIPTRIAFQVSSKIDSRTILDQSGAETLLGHGDMLYLPPGTAMPERVHGAFVSDDEVHRVVEHLQANGGGADYVEGVLEEVQTMGDGVVVGASGLPEAGRRWRRRVRPAVRRGRAHRHRDPPRLDLRRAAAPEDRLQPRRPPDRSHGSRRHRHRRPSTTATAGAGAAAAALSPAFGAVSRHSRAVEPASLAAQTSMHAYCLCSMRPVACVCRCPRRAWLRTPARATQLAAPSPAGSRAWTGNFAQQVFDAEGEARESSSGTRHAAGAAAVPLGIPAAVPAADRGRRRPCLDLRPGPGAGDGARAKRRRSRQPAGGADRSRPSSIASSSSAKAAVPDGLDWLDADPAKPDDAASSVRDWASTQRPGADGDRRPARPAHRDALHDLEAQSGASPPAPSRFTPPPGVDVVGATVRRREVMPLQD